MANHTSIAGATLMVIVGFLQPAAACGRDSRFGPDRVENTFTATKSGDNLLLAWAPANGVGMKGGHHVYEAFDKQDIHDAPNRGDLMLVVEIQSPPPPPGPSIVGAVPKVTPDSFAVEVIYYQVVGVCCDKVTEGPAD